MEEIWDVLIVGGGPAGCTAGMYAARAGLKTLVLEMAYPGGQMAQASIVENCPGAEETDGLTLAQRMVHSLERSGGLLRTETVVGLRLKGAIKQVQTKSASYSARVVIYAAGASPRRLNVPGEAALLGKGVSYCASCDGPLYRGKTVAVMGGGNTAVWEAIHLASICREVLVICRSGALRAEACSVRQLSRLTNVHVLHHRQVLAILGQDHTQGLRLHHEGREEELPCSGVFLCIGHSPNTALVADQLNLTDSGWIHADESTQTNIPGVFAPGDVREKAFRQIVTAVADGANAARSAEAYLKNR